MTTTTTMTKKKRRTWNPCLNWMREMCLKNLTFLLVTRSKKQMGWLPSRLAKIPICWMFFYLSHLKTTLWIKTKRWLPSICPPHKIHYVCLYPIFNWLRNERKLLMNPCRNPPQKKQKQIKFGNRTWLFPIYIQYAINSETKENLWWIHVAIPKKYAKNQIKFGNRTRVFPIYLLVIRKVDRRK